MPGKVTHPWTFLILEVIQDGEWHEYKAVRDQAAMLVPAHSAFHAAEARRTLHYKRQNREVLDRQYGSREDTILSGQRAAAAKSIQSMARSGRIEIEYGDQPERKRPIRIRLRAK